MSELCARISKKNAGLVFLVLLMLAVRLIILLFPSQLLFAEPSEVFRGVLAKQIISGEPLSSFFDYLYNPYAGGSIVISLLAVPFFLAFKETVFSLKLAGLLFSVFSLILIYKLVYRHCGKKAALIAGFMFILPNQYLAQRSSMAIGDYCESILFSLLLVYIFFKIMDCRTAERHNGAIIFGYLFCFGLIAGFGIWFHYVVGIAVLACCIIWVFLDRNFFVMRKLGILVFGFSLGFSPWLYLNCTRDFQGCIAGRDYVWTHFFRGGPTYSLGRLLNTAFSGFPRALMFENRIVSEPFVIFFSRLYYFIFLFAFFGLVWAYREKIKLLLGHFFKGTPKNTLEGSSVFVIFVLLYLILFVFIYSFYAIPTTITGVGFHDYRRLLPVIPFAIMAIAVFFAPYLCVKKADYPWLTFLFPVIFIVFGILSNAPLVCLKNFGRSLTLQGYSYRLLGWNIADSSLPDIARWVRVIRQKKIANLSQVCQGLGEGIGDDLGDDITLEKFASYQRLLQQLDRACLKNIYYGIGVGATRAQRYKVIPLNELAKIINDEYLNDFMRGNNTPP